jgi:DNA-binding response OmpR family regulator
MTVQDLVVDFDRQQVMRAGKSVTLARVEFQLLAMLARNSGRVVGCTDIVRAIHGYTCSEAEAQGFVKVYVARIRKKLEDDPRAPRYIVNVRGAGYLLERRLPDAANGARDVAGERAPGERLG